MTEMTDGIGLERDTPSFPLPPEATRQALRVEGITAHVGCEQTKTPFQHCFRPQESACRELGCHNTPMGGPARMEPFGPGAIVQKGLQASGLAATNPERARQRLLPQTHKLASHNPRGKGATDGSSMVAMMMKLARSGRSKARHGLIARYGGGQHGFAIGVYRFAYGQG